MSWIGSASMEKKVLREILLLQLTVYNSLKIPLKKSIFSKKKTVMQFLNIQCISMTQ